MCTPGVKAARSKLVAYAERLELLAGEGADGDAHVLDVLLALLRGDGDFFEHALLGKGDDRSARG